jgi:hypothetical protein
MGLAGKECIQILAERYQWNTLLVKPRHILEDTFKSSSSSSSSSLAKQPFLRQ